ncbi:NOTCH2 protein [Salpingoeca rosetta]|uniref:NOTCH2 protein n=1 Tax=Salpingoeca rosetta (strain ATCC 50818 / BSB-021) TaxID=946362 RepID=F2UFL8_SALR5|nr:NOTCH2 protein [Salpingoeca rosetta]EGD75586.1 NOTCH2 protein [Salpingoeca rosetta]|eukprot:XP_004992043.1 NOTCH2 protein [Salpingoeca rosetta]
MAPVSVHPPQHSHALRWLSTLLLVLGVFSSLLTTAAGSAIVLANNFGTCGIEPSLAIGKCGAVHVSLDSWELQLQAPADLECKFYHDSDCSQVVSSGLSPDIWSTPSSSILARTNVGKGRMPVYLRCVGTQTGTEVVLKNTWNGISTINEEESLLVVENHIACDPDPDRVVFSLSASATSVVEEDTPSITFNVSRTGPTDDDVSVRLAAVDFQASRNADYTRASASRLITFAAGQTWAQETIPILDDAFPELAESFALALTQPTLLTGSGREVVLEDGAAVVLITIQPSDDPHGVIALRNPNTTIALTEPLSGATTITIPLVRTGGTFGSVTVDWIIDGDAQTHDFDALQGSVTFGSAEAAANITLQLRADNQPELLEQSVFRLLTASNGATVDAASAALTLTVDPNDDPHGVVYVQASEQQLIMHHTGQRALRILAQRSAGTQGAVNVTFSVTFGTSNIISNNLACLQQFIIADSVTIAISHGAASAEAVLPFSDTVLLEQGAGFCLQATAVALADGSPVLVASDSLSPRLNTSRVDARVVVARAFANGVVGFAGTSINQAEPATQQQDITILLVRSGGGYGTLDVQLSLTGNSEYAVPGQDVTLSSNVSHFDAGDSLHELTVSVHPDNIPELAEQFFVTVADIPSGRAAIDSDSSVLTVTVPKNDDANGVLGFEVTGYRVSETDPSGHVVLNVTRTRGAFQSVSVAFATSDGTAVAGTNYEAQSGTLVFGEGERSKEIAVGVLDAGAPRAPVRTLTVTLGQVIGGARVAAASATATVNIQSCHHCSFNIIDSPSPLVTAEPAGTNTADVTEVAIPVRRTPDTFGPATLHWTVFENDPATGDITAVQASMDFVDATGAVSFVHGQQDAVVVLHIRNDNEPELTERFSLVLVSVDGDPSLGINATLPIDIVANDLCFGSFSFSAYPAAVTVYEPQDPSSGARVHTFNITRARGTFNSVRVSLELQLLTAGDSAATSDDAVLLTPSVVFAEGQTSALARVSVTNDNIPEIAESIILRAASVAVLNTNETVTSDLVTIDDTDDYIELVIAENDDARGVVSIRPLALTASEGGAPSDVQFTLTRTRGVFGVVTVTAGLVSVASGTAGVNASNVATLSGPEQDAFLPMPTVTFVEGQTEAMLSVGVVDDDLPEVDEQLRVVLVNTTGGLVVGANDTAVLTIAASDAAFGDLSITNASTLAVLHELEGEDAMYELEVLRGGGDFGTITVEWHLEVVTPGDGGTTSSPLVLGSDISPSSGTLTFAPGQRRAVVALTVYADNMPETNEEALLVLSSPTNGAQLQANATSRRVVIEANQEPHGVVSLADATIIVDEGAGTVSVAVTRESGAIGQISVDVTVRGVSAAGGGVDFAATNTTLVFAPGVRQLAHPITIIDDDIPELDETLVVSLSNPTGGALLGAITQTEITIFNNDDAFGLVRVANTTPADVAAFDESAADSSIVFTIVRDAGAFTSISVPWSLQQVAGSSAATPDFDVTAGVVQFAEGERVATITVHVLDDDVPEDDETYQLVLSSVTGSARAHPQLGRHNVTIAWNDNAFGIISVQAGARSQRVAESDGSVSIPLQRTQGTFRRVGVNWVIAVATVSSGDVSPTSGTAYFEPGSDTAAIVISITDDAIPEVDEGFTVSLQSVTVAGALLVSDLNALRADVTIVANDDPHGVISLRSGSGTLALTSGGLRSLRVTLDRSGGTILPIDITFSVLMSLPPGGVQASSGSGGGTAERSPCQAQTIVSSPQTVTMGDKLASRVVSLLIEETAVLVQDAVFCIQLDSVVLSRDGSHTNTSTGPSPSLAASMDARALNVSVSSAYANGLVAFGDTAGTVHVTEAADLDAPETQLVPVVRSDGSFGDVALAWEIVPSHTGDFDAVSGTVMLPSGQSFASIPITAVKEQVPELDELFQLRLTGITSGTATLGAGVNDTRVQLLIPANDDPFGVLGFEVTGYRVSETDPSGHVVLNVTRTRGAFQSVSVAFATSDGTAVAGTNYEAQSGTLVFGEGERSKEIAVGVLDAGAPRAPVRTLTVTLGQVIGGARVAAASATVTVNIQSCHHCSVFLDPTQDLFVGEEPASPDPADATGIDVRVLRQPDSYGSALVGWRVVHAGTNTLASDDFVDANGTVTLEHGETETTLRLLPRADATPETAEAFEVELTSVSGDPSLGSDDVLEPVTRNVQLEPSDQPYGLFRIGTAYVRDGNSGAVNSVAGTADSVSTQEGDTVQVTIDRQHGTLGAVDVYLMLLSLAGEVPADNAATPGDDIAILHSAGIGAVRFADGQTRANATLAIIDDGLPELDERLVVALLNATIVGDTLAASMDARRVRVSNTTRESGLTIAVEENDDAHGVFELSAPSLANETLSEGAVATVTVERRRGTFGAAGVSLVLSSVVDDDNTATTDAVLSQTDITFVEGESSVQVTLTVLDDAVPEDTESFVLSLSAGSVTGGARLSPNAWATQAAFSVAPNDDPFGVFTLAQPLYSVDEPANVTVTVLRSAGLYRTVSIPWQVNQNATSPDVAPSSGVVVFVPGQTEAYVQLTVIDDSIPEDREDVVFTLQAPTSPVARIERNTTTIRIAANDFVNGVLEFEPGLSVLRVGEDVGLFSITVRRRGGTQGTVSAAYETLDLTATRSSNDYAYAQGRVEFAPGETEQTISLIVVDDDVPEDDERFLLVLSDAQGGAVLGLSSQLEAEVAASERANAAAVAAADLVTLREMQVTNLSANITALEAKLDRLADAIASNETSADAVAADLASARALLAEENANLTAAQTLAQQRQASLQAASSVLDSALATRTSIAEQLDDATTALNSVVRRVVDFTQEPDTIDLAAQLPAPESEIEYYAGLVVTAVYYTQPDSPTPRSIAVREGLGFGVVGSACGGTCFTGLHEVRLAFNTTVSNVVFENSFTDSEEPLGPLAVTIYNLDGTAIDTAMMQRDAVFNNAYNISAAFPGVRIGGFAVQATDSIVRFASVSFDQVEGGSYEDALARVNTYSSQLSAADVAVFDAQQQAGLAAQAYVQAAAALSQQSAETAAAQQQEQTLSQQASALNATLLMLRTDSRQTQSLLNSQRQRYADHTLLLQQAENELIQAQEQADQLAAAVTEAQQAAVCPDLQCVSSITVEIAHNDDAFGVFSINATAAVASATAGEGQAFVVPVVRAAGTFRAVSLQWRLNFSSTASPADIAAPTTGALTFSSRQTSAELVLPIVDDAVTEEAEHLSVILTNVSLGRVEDPSSLTLTIDASDAVGICTPTSCANNATCVDGVFDVTCLCQPGFAGDRCDININECANVTCFNGGTCADRINDFDCACINGFQGKLCEISPLCDQGETWCFRSNACVHTAISQQTCQVPCDSETHVFCFASQTCRPRVVADMPCPVPGPAPLITAPFAISVAEDTAVLTSLASVYATPRHRWGENITYFIEDVGMGGGAAGDVANTTVAGPFAIDTLTGVISLVGLLDREQVDAYTLLVTAVDSAPDHKTNSTTVTVVVTDVNDNSPTFAPATPTAVSVLESASVGTQVAQLVASDPDAGANGNVRFTLDAGNALGSFQLDSSSGVLSVAGTLDGDQQTSYTLTISAHDQGTPPLTTTTTLEVNVVVYPPPAFTDGGSYTAGFPEEATGLVVRVSATVQHPYSNDAVMYAVVSAETSEGDDVTSHVGVNSTGHIHATQALDRESYAFVVVTVAATDFAPLRKTSLAVVNVTVVDVNDNAPVFDSSVADGVLVFVREEDAPGTLVTDELTAQDADQGDNARITYSIVSGNTGNAFSIDADTGVVTLAAQLNGSVVDEYVLGVEARDNAAHVSDQLSSVVSVNVSVVYFGAPVFGAPSYRGNVSEDAGVGTGVVRVCATAQHDGADQGIDFAIVSGNVGGVFGLRMGSDNVSAEVYVAGPLDRETRGVYVLGVVGRDRGPLRKRSGVGVRVDVLDVNDHVPVVVGADGGESGGWPEPVVRMEVREEASVGSVVGVIVSEDGDAGAYGTVTVSVGATRVGGGDFGGVFSLDGGSGRVLVAGVLDGAETPEYVVEVIARDGGGLTSNATLIITVIYFNGPRFNATSYAATAAEDVVVGATIVNVFAVARHDQLDRTIDYSLADSLGLFDVTADGRIVAAAPLDYETATLHELTVVATDHGPLRKSSNVTVVVTVTDVNDNAPEFSPPSYTFTIREDASEGVVVGSVNAFDLDSGANAALHFSTDSPAFAVASPSSSGVTTVDVVVTAYGAVTLDGLQEPTITLTVTARDGGSPALSSTATVTIDVTLVPTVQAPYLKLYNTLSAASGFIPAEFSRDVSSLALVSDFDTRHGVWDISVDDGSTWTRVNTGARWRDNTALVLRTGESSSTLLRFVPTEGFAGVATVHVRAYNGDNATITGAAAGAAADALVDVGASPDTLHDVSGNTALGVVFVAAPLSSVQVAESTNVTVDLPNLLEDTSLLQNVGVQLTSLLQGHLQFATVSGPATGMAALTTGGCDGTGTWCNSTAVAVMFPDDVDTLVQPRDHGIVVESVSESAGVWQSRAASVTGFEETLVGDVVPLQSLLRFVPAAEENGLFEMVVRGWHGKLHALARQASTTAHTITIRQSVVAVADAPRALTANVTLAPVPYEVTAQTANGSRVDESIAGHAVDADGQAIGLAVVGVANCITTTATATSSSNGDRCRGSWQYLLDSTQEWRAFPLDASDQKAVLLAPHSRVRFVPLPNYFWPRGNASVWLRVRYWDMSVGRAGDTAMLADASAPQQLLFPTAFSSRVVSVFVDRLGCDGEVGSQLSVDACGVCGGNGSACAGCDGVLASNVQEDACGECGGDGSSCMGCDLVPLSNAQVDECGICGGQNLNKDCAGVCFGVASRDDCGACFGGDAERQTPDLDKDCDGVCFGAAFVDDCGACVEGATGLSANYNKDCAGVCFGGAQISDVCALQGVSYCGEPVLDCSGECFGSRIVSSCGDCVQPDNATLLDCAGVSGVTPRVVPVSSASVRFTIAGSGFPPDVGARDVTCRAVSSSGRGSVTGYGWVASSTTITCVFSTLTVGDYDLEVELHGSALSSSPSSSSSSSLAVAVVSDAASVGAPPTTNVNAFPYDTQTFNLFAVTPSSAPLANLSEAVDAIRVSGALSSFGPADETTGCLFVTSDTGLLGVVSGQWFARRINCVAGPLQFARQIEIDIEDDEQQAFTTLDAVESHLRQARPDIASVTFTVSGDGDAASGKPLPTGSSVLVEFSADLNQIACLEASMATINALFGLFPRVSSGSAGSAADADANAVPTLVGSDVLSLSSSEVVCAVPSVQRSATMEVMLVHQGVVAAASGTTPTVTFVHRAAQASARFSASGRHLVVTFDVGVLPVEPCAAVFTAASRSALDATACTWTTHTLTVSLGRNATLLPGDRVWFAPVDTSGDVAADTLSTGAGIHVAGELHSYAVSGSVVVGLPDDYQPSIPRFTLPQQVRACAGLLLDASASHVAAGRPATFHWSALAHGGEDTTALEAHLASVSGSSDGPEGVVVEVASSLLRAGTTYTFGLAIEDALGVRSSVVTVDTTVMVQGSVGGGAQQVASLEILGIPPVLHASSDLTVRVRPVAPLHGNTCAGESLGTAIAAALGAASGTSADVQYCWQLSPARASNGGAPLAVASACAPTPWFTVSGTLLLPHQQHTLTVTVRVTSEDAEAPVLASTSTVFDVVPTPLEASVLGGDLLGGRRTVPLDATISLDASVSSDPDATDELELFGWRCEDIALSQPCSTTANGNVPSVLLFPATPQLSQAAADFGAGSYRFTATYRKGGRFVDARAVVEVVEAPVAPQLRVFGVAQGYVPTPTEHVFLPHAVVNPSLPVTVVVEVTHASALASATWSVVADSSSGSGGNEDEEPLAWLDLEATALTPLTYTQAELAALVTLDDGTQRTFLQLTLPPDAVVSGATYRFRCTAATAAEHGFAEATVVGNHVPSGGALDVVSWTMTNNGMGVTRARLTAQGWGDADLHYPLMYRFGVGADPATRVWLTTFDYSSRLSGVVLPAPASNTTTHVSVVLQVRDRLGATAESTVEVATSTATTAGTGTTPSVDAAALAANVSAALDAGNWPLAVRVGVEALWMTGDSTNAAVVVDTVAGVVLDSVRAALSLQSGSSSSSSSASLTDGEADLLLSAVAVVANRRAFLSETTRGRVGELTEHIGAILIPAAEEEGLLNSNNNNSNSNSNSNRRRRASGAVDGGYGSSSSVTPQQGLAMTDIYSSAIALDSFTATNAALKARLNTLLQVIARVECRRLSFKARPYQLENDLFHLEVAVLSGASVQTVDTTQLDYGSDFEARFERWACDDPAPASRCAGVCSAAVLFNADMTTAFQDEPAFRRASPLLDMRFYDQTSLHTVQVASLDPALSLFLPITEAAPAGTTDSSPQRRRRSSSSSSSSDDVAAHDRVNTPHVVTSSNVDSNSSSNGASRDGSDAVRVRREGPSVSAPEFECLVYDASQHLWLADSRCSYFAPNTGEQGVDQLECRCTAGNLQVAGYYYASSTTGEVNVTVPAAPSGDVLAYHLRAYTYETETNAESAAWLTGFVGTFYQSMVQLLSLQDSQVAGVEVVSVINGTGNRQTLVVDFYLVEPDGNGGNATVLDGYVEDLNTLIDTRQARFVYDSTTFELYNVTMVSGGGNTGGSGSSGSLGSGFWVGIAFAIAAALAMLVALVLLLQGRIGGREGKAKLGGKSVDDESTLEMVDLGRRSLAASSNTSRRSSVAQLLPRFMRRTSSVVMPEQLVEVDEEGEEDEGAQLTGDDARDQVAQTASTRLAWTRRSSLSTMATATTAATGAGDGDGEHQVSGGAASTPATTPARRLSVASATSPQVDETEFSKGGSSDRTGGGDDDDDGASGTHGAALPFSPRSSASLGGDGQQQQQQQQQQRQRQDPLAPLTSTTTPPRGMPPRVPRLPSSSSSSSSLSAAPGGTVPAPSALTLRPALRVPSLRSRQGPGGSEPSTPGTLPQLRPGIRAPQSLPRLQPRALPRVNRPPPPRRPSQQQQQRTVVAPIPEESDADANESQA